MPYFNIVAETSENTVVAGYEPVKRKADSYQSEAELEKEFIRILGEQGYEYLPIHTEDDLIKNLRTKLEELNHYTFSDDEWDRFFKNSIANPNDHIVEKTRKIQEDYVQVLIRDDGSSKNITLIDKKQVHNNRLQVINQYEVKQEDGARHDNRYDVTVLVNGFPLVHIELKRRGVPIREAFNQINRYQRDSFWTGSGLFEYVQIFVISNGTNTKYYSNSTRFNAIKDANSRNTRREKTSNSFEFTSFWADADNQIIPDLIDFTKTFFAKHSLLNIITKYCVFTAEDMLLVMRPYQITATERILNRIEIANNYKKYGTIPLVPKTYVNLCTECKACAKACPAGAISMENPKKTDKKKCISCMKCVYSCKKKARYVSNMKLNMAQKKLTKICKSDKQAEIFI